MRRLMFARGLDIVLRRKISREFPGDRGIIHKRKFPGQSLCEAFLFFSEVYFVEFVDGDSI